MTEKKLYLILQSVLCILLVVLLSVSALSIYREGKAQKAENPMASIYTREKTAEKFKPIAPLFFGAIGMTVAGWILAVKDENADKPVKDAELTRDLTVARVAQPSEEMKSEQKRQKKRKEKAFSDLTPHKVIISRNELPTYNRLCRNYSEVRDSSNKVMERTCVVGMDMCYCSKKCAYATNNVCSLRG